MNPPENITKPISVCILISSLEFGGAERQVVEMVNTVDRKRVTPIICSLSHEVPLAVSLVRNGEDLKIVERKGRFDITAVFRFARFLREHRIEVVHAFLSDAEVVARLAAPMGGNPLVVASERNTEYFRPFLPRTVLKLTMPLVDVMVANSNAGKDFNIKTNRLADSLIEVVHNGVDTARFCPDSEAGKNFRSRLNIPNDAPIVGMVGNFKRQKGHEFFVQMAAKVRETLPATRFLIVGGDIYNANSDSVEYQAEIRNLASTLHLENHLQFLGTCDDMKAFYNACDVTVLLSRHEGTPNVVLESMACGVPVVVSDVSDNALIVIDSATGYVVPPGAFDAAADRVAGILLDSRLQEKLGIAARERVTAEFSLARAAEKLTGIYEKRLTRKLLSQAKRS